MATAQQADPTSPEVLTAFYSRLYPFKSIYTWLAQARPSDPSAPRLSRVNPTWTNREFAFTLQGDIYLRYNSFQDAEEFKKQVLKLVPSRFEVGAVYNAKVGPLFHH
jgi:DNA primase small subunit